MKAAEQIRLSGNSDTGLKIKAVSSDDLYIFAEIAKKVLHESEKLSIEINQLMTNILTKAKVNTVERENVNINLRTPKSKGTIVCQSHLFSKLIGVYIFFKYELTQCETSVLHLIS